MLRRYQRGVASGTHRGVPGSSMRLASWDSWLLLLISVMLGNSCRSLRAVGGVWELLVGGALGVRALGSTSAPSAESSGLRVSEHGTTDMEMERPCEAGG